MNTTATTKSSPETRHDEIARIAYLNWQEAGCPAGRDFELWLGAERQIAANRPESSSENGPQAAGKSKTSPLPTKPVRKKSARRALEQNN